MKFNYLKSKFWCLLFIAQPCFGLDIFISNYLDFDKLSLSQKEDICFQNVGVFFIGNAEDPFAGYIDGSIPPSPEKNGSENLRKIIDFQIMLLRQSLSQTACRDTIQKGIAKGKRPPRALLTAVRDGPDQGDSKLQVTEYEWKDLDWNARPGKSKDRLGTPYSDLYLSESLELTPEEVPNFEIHLPSQSDLIVREMAKRHSDQIKIDKYIYIFKTHGSKFVSQAHDYDLLDKMTMNIPEEIPIARMFMFDPHGPDYLGKDKHTADIYNPYWLPYQGCQALSLDERVTPELIEANTGLCSCRVNLLKYELPLNRFKACEDLPFFDPFTNPFGSPFLSGAKSLAYRNYPQLVLDKADLAAPRGVQVFASAISYGSIKGIDGIYQPSFPTGPKPTLVLMDSCYAHSDVHKIFDRSDANNKRIVTITSDEQVSMNVSNFGMLDFTGYAMLTDIPAWLEDEDKENEEAYDDLYFLDLGLYEIFTRTGLVDLNWALSKDKENRAKGEESDLNALIKESRGNNNPYRSFSINVF